MTTRIGFGGGCLTLTGTWKGTVVRKVNDKTIRTHENPADCSSNVPISGDEPYSALGSYKHELIFNVEKCSSSWKSFTINIYDYDTRAILVQYDFDSPPSSVQTKLTVWWNRSKPNNPIYLERLGQLDNKARVLTRNSLNSRK